MKKKKTNDKVLKLKRKKKGRGAKIGGFLLLVIITAFVMMLTPYFNIKWYDISGNEKVSNALIMDTAGLTYNVNLFKVNLEKTEKSISEIPYVDTVKVRRKLPDGIRIFITERTPVAYMPFGTAFVMIDKTGRLLESAEKLEGGPELPVVNGISIDNFQLGMSLEGTNPSEVKALSELLEKLDEYGLTERVTSFDIGNPGGLTFIFDNDKTVVVGDSFRLDYKLMMLKAAIEELAPSEAGTIDLTIEGKAIFTPLETSE